MANASTAPAASWFQSMNWKVFPFQEKAWDAYLDGKSGMINAPTGSGKTYSILIPVLLEYLRENHKKKSKGLKLIWITPIRALAKEIKISAERAIEGLGMDWQVAIRSGDTSSTDRKGQWTKPPQILITTPESVHVMMATRGYTDFFDELRCIVVDEWHELIGSKRGVQTELAIARLRSIQPDLKIWGISATIGNMQEAQDVLLHAIPKKERSIIRSDIKKDIELRTIIPEEIEKYPWSGHLGLKLLPDIVKIIQGSKTTLIFTNTRAQCEIWYQKILHEDDSLAGLIAMHHGSISRDIRDWVEDALYEGRLRAVVCTSSLDLGVDFRPVETIVQIGSPKGVSRFVQRAGRSGHQPGAKSIIYFAPTHALELVEAAALRAAIHNQDLEDRIPYIRSFDVLIQYLMTLAVSEGFDPAETYEEITKTYAYESISEEEWNQLLHYLVHGTKSLQAYDEYQKIGLVNGRYRALNKRISQRHKMSIGTIVSSTMIQIAFVNGKRIGTIEEYFISQLSQGDTFWFAGRGLEFIRLKDMVAQVKPSKKKSGRIPSYAGGRMPLSSMMSKVLKAKIYDYAAGKPVDDEIHAIDHLLRLQQERSIIPQQDEFLVEYFEDKEGFHLLMYPFEGRYVHEGMGAFIAKRLARTMPISFSIAMNDYGFELLSDKRIDVEEMIQKELFDTKHLEEDIQASINAVEMARRKFRDIAKISGLIFQGYPGRQKKERHLQSSAQLLFDVFKDYEPDNLLFQQTYDEVMTFQLESSRMRKALQRIQEQHIIISTPEKASPFAFPIIVDRLRESMTSESLQDRISRMRLQLEK